jgi:hypothetical protein
MAFLDEEFSVDSLPVGTSNFEPLPEGWYNATITKTEQKTPKSGDGWYISCKYTITGPTHQGRVVFGKITVKHSSIEAEKIGRVQLGEIMKAIGLSLIKDDEQLIGGNLSIKLVVKTGEYAGNEIKGYRALGGVTPAAVAPFKPVGPAAGAAPAKSAPPWAKK